MKRKAVILQIITLTTVALISLAACQQRRPFKSTQKVSDPNSPLLGALMDRSEIPGNWIWYVDHLYQAQEASKYPAYDLVDAAARGVTGDYGTQPYYIQITHRLERYQTGSPPLETLQQWIEGSFASEEKSRYIERTFSPTFVSVGTGLVSKCVGLDSNLNPTTAGVGICLVAARYNHIVSYLMVYVAPGSLDDHSATEILNQIVSEADGRIKELDK